MTCEGSSFHTFKGIGLVRNVFNNDNMKRLKGNMGIGHTRYSTTCKSDSIENCQPFVVHSMHGSLAVAHNGEIVNSSGLRKLVRLNLINKYFYLIFHALRLITYFFLLFHLDFF